MSSCHGVTKQGAPCSVSWGISATGFCKFHAPDARQCLGTSRSSGQRCRIRWDLDADGFCAHHRPADLPAVAAPSAACRGRTKRGTACSVTWGLDAQGFCKFHVPDASQCRGLARASGRRCKIKWGLDERGYCQFHRRVDAPAARQCAGRRCGQTVGIDVHGFCTAHRAVDPQHPLCRRERCGNNAKDGYNYCCAAHDPEFAASYVAPSMFNEPGLRSNAEGEIVKLFKSRDLYHGEKLDLNTVGAVELDHILEKQCFAYAFQHVEFEGEEEAKDVAFVLREEVVNELPNLCLTRATTNKIKGAAVLKFLDDSLTGHRKEKSFTDYLLSEERDETRLSRDVTRTIRREMGSALRRCQRKLAEEGGTPAFDALSAELQQLYVDMDLHTSRTSKTKSKAGVLPPKIEENDDDYVLVDSAATDPWTVVDIKHVKQYVKVEASQPTLRANAKPFVPGATRLGTDALQTDTNVATVKVEHRELKPDEFEPKNSAANGSVASVSLHSETGTNTRVQYVKQEKASDRQSASAKGKQLPSESTSERVVKGKETKAKGA
ncbi:hypothetical protein PRIC1_006526 [Phytophthora ramorum]